MLLTLPSTNDDMALRNKVNEALNVYDEYLRSQKESSVKDGPDASGTENERPRADAEGQA